MSISKNPSELPISGGVVEGVHDENLVHVKVARVLRPRLNNHLHLYQECQNDDLGHQIRFSILYRPRSYQACQQNLIFACLANLVAEVYCHYSLTA